MKKILLCLLALAAGLTAFGQNESSFGVRAGLNVANLHLSAGGLSASLDSRASYHVGFAYQQPVLRVLPLYFETGLYLSGRGASVTAGDLDLDVEGQAKFNMLYLQVPASTASSRATPRKSICSRRFQCPSRTAPSKGKCSSVPISDCASA